MSSQRSRSWPRFWDEPFTSTDPLRAQAAIRKAKARRPEMLAAIAAASPARAKRLLRRYTFSGSARLASLAIVADRRLPTRERRDAAPAMVELAAEANPWRPAQGRTIAVPKDRPGKDPRYVFVKGFIDAARDRLAHDAAAALSQPEPEEFARTGGRPALEAWLTRELPRTELVITTDIPSAFDNVLREAVDVDLPLPRRIKEEVLYRPMDGARFLMKGPSGSLIQAPRRAVAKVSSPKRGIPQGTALAAVTSELVIRQIRRGVEAVCENVRFANYNDNLIILLGDRADEERVKSALATEVEKRFGSDVTRGLTSRTEVHRPSQPFYFCGRQYSWRRGKLRTNLDPDRVGRAAGRRLIDVSEALRGKDRVRLEKLDRSLMGLLRETIRFKGAADEIIQVMALYRSSTFWNERQASRSDGDPPLIEALDP